MPRGRDLAKTIPNEGARLYMSNRYVWRRLVDPIRCEAKDRECPRVLALVDRMVGHVTDTMAPGPNHDLRFYGRLQKGLRVARYMVEGGFNLDHREFTSNFVHAMVHDMLKFHSSRTVVDTLSHLRCFFEHLVECKEIEYSPVVRSHNVRVERIKLPIIKPQECMRYANLLAAEGDFDSITYAMAMSLCAHSGIRLQELWRLRTISFVATDDRFGPHLVIDGKKNQQRIAPLTRRFANILKRYIAKCCNRSVNGYLFHEPMGHEYPMLIKRFSKRIRDLRRENRELQRFTITAARRGFATELFARGLPFEQIKDLYDHSRSNITLGYIAREESVQARAVGRFHPMFRRPRNFVRSKSIPSATAPQKRV